MLLVALAVSMAAPDTACGFVLGPGDVEQASGSRSATPPMLTCLGTVAAPGSVQRDTQLAEVWGWGALAVLAVVVCAASGEAVRRRGRLDHHG